MVQHILIHGEPWHKAAILSAITGVPNAEASKARAAAAAAAGTTAGVTATAAAAGSANAVSASAASNGNGNGNGSASTSPTSGNGFGSVSGSHPSGPPKVLHMAKHKFASNVVEKCWLHAGSRERMDLIDQILGKENERQTDSLNSPFLSLVKDQYGVSHLHFDSGVVPLRLWCARCRMLRIVESDWPAHLNPSFCSCGCHFSFRQNYVVQGIVDNATDDERAVIIQRIKRQGANLRKIPYGKVATQCTFHTCPVCADADALRSRRTIDYSFLFSPLTPSPLSLLSLYPALSSPLLQHIIAKIEKLTGARWEEQAQQTPQSLSPGAAPAVPATDAAGPNNAFLTQTQNQPAAQ